MLMMTERFYRCIKHIVLGTNNKLHVKLPHLILKTCHEELKYLKDVSTSHHILLSYI